MRHGYMYLAPLESNFYAFIPKRRWYAPWVWDVYAEEWSPAPALETNTKLLASNVRYDNAKGLIKMLGASNVED